MVFDTGGLYCVVCGIHREDYRKFKEAGFDHPCVMGTSSNHHAFLKSTPFEVLRACCRMTETSSQVVPDDVKKRIIDEYLKVTGFRAEAETVESTEEVS